MLVYPKAFVGKYASLKRGCIIESMAVVNFGATIGECIFASAGAIINYRILINAYGYINSGAIVRIRICNVYVY